MDFIKDDEEEIECENKYINLLRNKRNIIEDLWQEFKSNFNNNDYNEEEK